MWAQEEGPKKQPRSKFQKHLNVLMWKAYLQRLRRWRTLVAECIFALILCIIAVMIARPAFLTPLEAEPTPPVSYRSILNSLHKDTIIGYAPNKQPYINIMERTAEILGTEIIAASDEHNLNKLLYNRANKNTIVKRVIWILWEEQVQNVYKMSIRSTEVGALYVAENSQVGGARTDKVKRNPHLQAGFLSVECAVCHALLEYTRKPDTTINYNLNLVAMPVSPLMEEDVVRRAISLILMCYTLALLPPVLETEVLVVIETERRIKRALRIRNVDFSIIYIGWLSFALLTAMPICLICSISLILIFRWIHLMYALLTLLSYFTIMMTLAFIFSMFHTKAIISAVWTVLQTLLQTFLAELIVHHKNFDDRLGVVTLIFKSILPPLGLLNGFNQFAFLRTGQQTSRSSMLYTIISWVALLVLYFMLLMLLQRTIGSEKAIGGQVSWKSIIFKKPTDKNQLRPIQSPIADRKGKLQEVDELVAKAASFSNVSKGMMGVPLLNQVTFDIYRGEFTSIFAERIQDRTITCAEDLLIGLTYPDSGSITVLGVEVEPSRNLLTEHMMTGYCDQSSILIDDLTVEEHFYFYTEICLWHELSDDVFEFSVIRHNILKEECDLADVYLQRVDSLSMYYRAQLCWAIAILLEPRLVILPEYSEHPTFRNVIKDKIMKYKSFTTIVSLTVSSMELQYADRVFLLDNRVLAFGGTPAYMFYRYGRDYRIRINFTTGTTTKTIKEFAYIMHGLGAVTRAQLGSLLILRMPTTPSANIAKLTEYVEVKTKLFGIASMYVSLPDPEEVFRRAIHESREKLHEESEQKNLRIRVALAVLAQEKVWKPTKTFCFNFMHIRVTAWKYFACYIHYRFFFIITVLSAVIAGVCIGLSLSNMLKSFETDKFKTIGVETLTVEAKGLRTTLIVRVDNSDIAQIVASGYVLSHTNASDQQLSMMSYSAMVYPESLTEYLATRAIDSPQHYVHLYAYGMDINSSGTTIDVRALYSPLHKDRAAAARSLARVYMALMRYYSGKLDASIEIEDNPLILDYTMLIKDASEPPLLIQTLLVLTISHISLVPSKEYGLVRHMQIHAMNFSPLRYWLNLAICDVILYSVLVFVITIISVVILFIYLMHSHLRYADLVAIPFMLVVYGTGCVPQAYLFSLGRSSALNTMALVITNIVFGEATIVAKLFYGDAYNYALSFMALSPQFNMAYALVKIRQIFLYNSECIIFEMQKLCENKILHKCCKKCGVLQECYSRKSYLVSIMPEVGATLGTAVMMFIILFLWEYRLIQLLANTILRRIFIRRPLPDAILAPGTYRERTNVTKKDQQLKDKVSEHGFGDSLLLVNVSRVQNQHYLIRHVSLGLSKGQALALSGMRRHGRVILCDMIAGYKNQNEGQFWALSKYRQRYSPHKYARQVALCSRRKSLPDWMTVYDGLEMLAMLRGVPYRYRSNEVTSYIDALDLDKQADLQICHLIPSERHRLHFAAAVIGAPPILVLDECTAYQTLTVQRSMYFIMNLLRKREHCIVHSAFSIEAHMPVTDHLAIMRDGRIFDIDKMDALQERYGNLGYTVVVHLKDEVDVNKMFEVYFQHFAINDTTDVLVNVQILDNDLTWASIFKKMEMLKEKNDRVYSYIVCTKPIDYIYQNIIADDTGLKPAADILSWSWLRSIVSTEKDQIEPAPYKLLSLRRFTRKYSLTKLGELPWSVIFQR